MPTLWRYLWGWVVGVLLLVWVTLFLVAWYTGKHEAEEVTDGQLEAVARLWLPVVTGPTSVAPEPIGQRRSRPYVQDVAVIRWQGDALVTDTHQLAQALDVDRYPLSLGFSERVQTTPTGEVRWRVFVADEGPARVAVLMDMRHRINLARDMSFKLARAALLVLPLVAVLLWWALRRGLRPLNRLSRDVASLDVLAGQRLDQGHRFREFSSTVSAINTLVDSLQMRARREREFASDVAHELRTPLAALALQARAAQSDPSSTRLSQVEDNALRAGHILSQLLDLARAQRGGPDGSGQQAWADVALGELAERQVALHAPDGFRSGHELSLEQPKEAVIVRAQPLLLELALRNLIENALRHTPAGTQVVVAVWRQADGVGISVSDDGQRAGVPAPARPSDGLGLGLRLVTRIAEQLGASLERDTGEPPMTTRFNMIWPAPGP
ncbi:HAMP domain-containing sensor histidine kinase [Hydrogenophaga sp.]|uniref:sensor histidine kinase n=1 Tax=Hydrogenophaga sp. TaxID=1904254 RepID=UPI00261D459C|nr:HAMP domain-containing sensor histidine kinase [Hydrogenophaga sp.]MCW5654915.1 HAMP domain-containing histidine kinase [Hydrogenophaga sp.]